MSVALIGVDPRTTRWVRFTQKLLRFTGWFHLLVLPFVFPWWVETYLGLDFALEDVVVFPIAASLYFLAAWGLGRRARWAWRLSLVVSIGCALCWPALFGLLREDTRRAYRVLRRA